MANRLAGATSPYLLQHAENPVDWWPWGSEPFAAAAERDVPVLVSIGYSTCHWCHVMARESFGDPRLAARLNAAFVAIKVDREEHPDVDASYLAAASAFTRELGWPLTVFATPAGRPFYAGTYFPPHPIGGRPSFGMVLDAVAEAWRERRAEVTATAESLGRALAEAARLSPSPPPGGTVLDDAALDGAVRALADREDPRFGGFGTAPKFPVATVLQFLLGRAEGRELAVRTLDAMAASPLRDAVEGGFFRYATRADWSEPHYERMLYDNALLLAGYARAGRREPARQLAGFLLGVLRLPSGGFASAQDSESVVDGERSEGGYYRLPAERRAEQTAPALDEKVLTGWNGLAIGALALAGRLLDEPDWIAAAERAASLLLGGSPGGSPDGPLDGPLVRARLGDRVSAAPPTLEDHGMLAGGLLELAVATGDARWAVQARRLVLEARAGLPPDATLAAQGLAVAADPSEGAYPSGASALAAAQLRLFLLGAGPEHREAARSAMARVADLALGQPLAFGASLAVMSELAAPVRQLVVVDEDRDSPLAAVARHADAAGAIAVTPAQARAFAAAGFELFDGRGDTPAPAAFLCQDFVCRLPVHRPEDIGREAIGREAIGREDIGREDRGPAL
ncbi:MAG: thioredoxin domain-containing protein [Microbacteriaceae bacterium]